MSKKRILTVDELLEFCKSNGLHSFDSSKDGELALQMPGVFKFSSDAADGDQRGLRKFEARAFHDHVNLNHTNIETETLKKYLSTAAFRPILANIVTNEEGVKDFGAHDFHIVEDEEGNKTAVYDEQPVGTIDGSKTTTEYDEDAGVNRVVVSGYIFAEYCPDTIEVFERRGYDVECSVELTVEAFAYDAKKQAITLSEFYVSGLTLLGEDHKAGMEGSHMTLEVLETTFEDKGFNEILDKFNNILSKFENLQKGGKTVNKFEELLQKYGKTAEDVTFEYENLSDEELEAKFAEAFASAEAEPETTPEPQPTADANFSMACGDTKKEFSLSLSDKVKAVYKLVNATYTDDWYGVNVYEDDGFVEMYGWCYEKNYRQNFTVEGDVYSLVGDRVEVFAKYLTQEEVDKLEAMKSNYAALEQYKNDKEAEIAHADKMSALVGYATIENTDEYKALVENVDKYSKEELVEKADAIVGRYARQGMQLHFESNTQQQPTTRVKFGIKDNDVVPENVKSYSDIFD